MKITNNIPKITEQPRINQKNTEKVSSGKDFEQIINSQAAEENKKIETTSKPSIRSASSDPANVAKQAAQMKEITNFIKNSDDIRTDKVEDIKTRIANGTYKVSSEDLADKLISSGLVDGLLKSI